MPKRVAGSPSDSPKKLRRSNLNSPGNLLKTAGDLSHAKVKKLEIGMDTRGTLPALAVKKELFVSALC